MIAARSFDLWEGYVGKRGTGKSTLALARAVEKAKEIGGAYVLVQDPQHRVPDTWPSGKPVGARRYSTCEEARKSIEADPRGIHVISSGRALPVIDLAKKISVAQFGEKNDKQGHPCIVILDEAVNIEGASPYFLSDEMRDLIAGCRHYNVGVIWTSQQPQFVHYSFMALSTRMVLFKVTDERGLANLRKAGVPDEVLAKLPTLHCDKKCPPNCPNRGQHIIFDDL